MAMLADLVLETANAPGTGTCNLLGAATDRVSFVSVFPTTSLVYYVLDDNAQSEWGVGTFVPGSPNTLQRTTVLGNTSGNTSRLNFTGVTKVFNALPAARTVYVDNTNTVVVPAGGRFGTVAGGIPIGAGMQFFGATAPAGWLFCGGQLISRSTYAALFAAIGIAYGAGDGSSTFAVPDLRGRVPVGLDNMGGTTASRISTIVPGATTLGTGAGDQFLHAHIHAVTVNDTVHTHGITDPQHTHTINDPQHQHGLPGAVMGSVNGIAGGSNYGYVGATTNFAATGIAIYAAATGISVNNASTGISTGVAAVSGSGIAQNVQPSLFCNHIIFAGV